MIGNSPGRPLAALTVTFGAGMGGSGGLVDCGIAVCCCKLDGEGATILMLTGCCPGVCASPGVLGPPLPTDLGPAGEGATVVTAAAAGLAPVGGWLTGESFEGGVGFLELPGGVTAGAGDAVLVVWWLPLLLLDIWDMFAIRCCMKRFCLICD